MTRSEIAGYFADLLLPRLLDSQAKLGRPGIFIVKCSNDEFREDLSLALHVALLDRKSFEVTASFPIDRDEVKAAAVEVMNALNNGRTHVYVVPNERVLKGVVPAIDEILLLPRFTPQTLAQACQSFFDFPEAPAVPSEKWVAHVAPQDLLINSSVQGDPIPHVRATVLRRLRDHDCSNAPPLESLLGMSAVRDWATALIDDIQDALDPEVRCQWTQIERAVVFAGSRGAGKASLSRAIARAAGLQWYSLSARRWATFLEEDSISVAVSAMEDDFDAARAISPTVLFIENLEDLPEKLLQALGQLVSRIDSLEPIFVIGSTIDEDFASSSHLRSANFEHTVYLPLPTSSLLESALKQHLKEMRNELSDEEISQVGRLALGSTASDLELYLRRASRIARRDGARSLTFDDLAVAIMETPSPGARPKISGEELRLTAYHEAGHAVMHFLDVRQGKEIQYASVVPRRMGYLTALGFVMRLKDEESYSLTKAEALARIRMMFGGRCAQEILSGADHVTTGSGGSDDSDLAKATKMAAHLIGRCGFSASESLVYRDARLEDDPELRKEVDVLLREQYQQTRKSLQDNWNLVEALAHRLLAEQELSGHEVRQILTEVRKAVS